MRKSSTARRSSSNPGRISTFEREEKSGGRSDARRTQIPKSKGATQIDSSHIPRARLRTSSNDRGSYRPSTQIKPPGKTPLRQQHLVGQPARISNGTTPSYGMTTPSFRASKSQLELPTGPRGRSPSAERASNFGAKGPRKDNRPLTDKAYQNFMLSKIDQYFYAIEQSALLNNNGSLKPITLKIFVEATNCLIKLLNVKQDLTMVNYMDDLPKVAKKLQYPGAVMKSWLKTANTMHSWPHVLGWLSWLTEVCEAKDKAEVAFSIDKLPFLDGKEDVETQRNSFMSILKFYKAWNDEKLDEEAVLVEKHILEKTSRDGDIEKQIEEELLLLDKENATKNDMDQQETETDEETQALNRVLVELEKEESTEIKGIEYAAESAKVAINETKQLNAACSKLEQEIENDNIERREMIIVVNSQTMSVEKRDDIMKQCTEIQNYIHQFDSHIHDIENELYALDLKFSSCNQNLYKSILAYNKDIIMLLGGDTEADLETLKFPETGLRRPDIMDTLTMKEAAMISFKEHFKRQIAQIEAENDAGLYELDARKEKLEALRNENKDYVEKAEEQRVCIQQVQRQAKDTESRLKEQIKQFKSDITQLKMTSPDIEAANTELAEVQDKLNAVIRRSEFVEKRMEKFFSELGKILTNHRSNLNNTLNKLPKNPLNGI